MMPNIDPALWRDIMAYLRKRHNSICRQWFEELEPVDLKGGLLRVATSNGVQEKYLQSKCLDQFNEAAQSATGALIGVRFVTGDPTVSAVKPGIGGPKPQPEVTITATVPPRPRRAASPSDFDSDQMVLSPDYSFDNFVTGPNNHLAYAASVAVANQPGTAYNPLFIHGGVGLGKTHLLQAICQSILHENPATEILYVSCDAFMNQFIQCVQSGQMNEFRNRYRHVDVLVIDDIHFLANRDRSQEEFFHTFNDLYQSNRQIVLSSDAAPNEISDLEDRLVSRFQWGLIAEVTKPGYETRVAILKAKSDLRSMNVPDEVIAYLATKIDSNARELEGAIVTIQGHANLQGRPIDMKLVQEALRVPVAGSKHSQVTLQHIIDAVTEYYGVKLSDLQSRRRHKSVTEPRQVCMWLARKRTRFSLEEIGGYFGGRDHTTVMHSIRTVDSKSGKDPEFAKQVQHLDEQISQGQGTGTPIA
jgi:chromosomal replication initiator protein